MMLSVSASSFFLSSLFLIVTIFIINNNHNDGVVAAAAESTTTTIATSDKDDNNENKSSFLLLQNMMEQTHPLWLRERCLESFYVDIDTRQPKYNLHEENETLTVTNIEYHNNNNNNNNVVTVSFSDSTKCHYDAHKLQADLNQETTFIQTPEFDFPPTYFWDSKSLVAPSMFHHDDIIEETDLQRKFLSTLISTGIAMVKDVPAVDGECTRFTENFSTIRDTEWGRVFNVRSTSETVKGKEVKDLSYSKLAIGMHIDSTYRIDGPPAYQALHALEHCSGKDCYVHNTFVDGIRVANDLCQLNRQYFDVLSTTVLRWENNAGDDSSFLYRYSPMIELDDNKSVDENGCPRVTGISFSAKSGGYAPNLPRDELEVFYEAKRTYSAMLHSDEYIIKLQFQPGLLIFWDNRRVLHSRSAIAETDGNRWLQGCYMNRDGINVQYEKLRRKWSKQLTETPFRNLREAKKEDYDRMGEEYDQEIVQKTLSNMIDLLTEQKNAYLGAPVSLMEHNIQTASRALRAGEDDETIVMSLFHDVFETLAVKNHGELIASMLAPWISPKSQWVLAHHEIFQGKTI